jgi:hypothetical protein
MKLWPWEKSGTFDEVEKQLQNLTVTVRKLAEAQTINAKAEAINVCQKARTKSQEKVD